MTEWLNPLYTVERASWGTAALSCLLAFGLTQIITGVYIWTFRGLSYSRTFVQGMALASIVTCMLMLAIGNNIATALGIAGGLSIIRFRTTMRDPRDMVFIFACLGAGIACGLQAYEAAIVGTTVFLGAASLLHLTSYGSRQEFDGLVRFSALSDASSAEAVGEALKTHCRMFTLVTLRETAQGKEMEHAYQISIPDPEQRGALVMSLNAIDGVHDVALLLQEPSLEL